MTNVGTATHGCPGAEGTFCALIGKGWAALQRCDEQFSAQRFQPAKVTSDPETQSHAREDGNSRLRAPIPLRYLQT